MKKALPIKAPQVADLQKLAEQSLIAQAKQRREQMDASFTYHAPKPGQPEIYQRLRDEAKKLAIMFLDDVPYSREQQIAINKLEEAVMWANKGIAIHGKEVVK